MAALRPSPHAPKDGQARGRDARGQGDWRLAAAAGARAARGLEDPHGPESGIPTGRIGAPAAQRRRGGIMVSEAVALGVVSIGIAVGLSGYWRIKDSADRKRRDALFVDRIAENVGKMAQYFLDVETETVRNEEREASAEGMVGSLGSFYRRNGQEMRDILYQTKLYLPFWSDLPPEGRKEADGMLDAFSWLVYGYYQEALPEQLRRIAVVGSRGALLEKKAGVMEAADSLLRRYGAQRAR